MGDVDLVISSLHGGPLCSVSLAQRSGLHELQTAVESLTGIPRYEQRFFHGAGEIRADEHLVNFLVRHDEAADAELLLVRVESFFCRIPRFSICDDCETIHEEEMMLEDAKQKANSLPDCQG